MVLKTVAVTGALGMLGQHIMSELLLTGFNVVPVSRPSNNNESHEGWDLLHWKSDEEFDRLLSSVDVVVHAGAAVPSVHKPHSDDELFYSNVGASLNIARWCRKRSIPFIYISTQGISREEHEEKLRAYIDSFDFDYIVLAKYMRILTSSFVKAYPQQIINIHHSFLPAFIGANPYKQAFERGVKIIGATAHYVTDDLDEGPIIAQDVIPVNHRLSWKDMQRAGRDGEKIVLSRALALVLNDRVFVNGNKTIIF